jgi:hypothetical protein
MASPFPRDAGYEAYRTASRNELHMPNETPDAQTGYSSPYNPYLRTEDASPYKDFTPGYTPGYSDTPAASTSYFDPQNPSQPSFQENYAKPNEPYAYAGQPVEAMPPGPPQPKRRTLFSILFDGNQRFPYFCWIVSIIQIGVFISELVRNAKAMGTPIEIQPVFNPLIGPSSYVHSLR